MRGHVRCAFIIVVQVALSQLMACSLHLLPLSTAFIVVYLIVRQRSLLKQQVSSLQSKLQGIKAAIFSTSPKSSVINGSATLQGSSVSAGSHHRVSVGNIFFGKQFSS